MSKYGVLSGLYFDMFHAVNPISNFYISEDKYHQESHEGTCYFLIVAETE